jgi:hypothetical protein
MTRSRRKPVLASKDWACGPRINFGGANGFIDNQDVIEDYSGPVSVF